ncbi:Uncharacterized protein QTN25_005563 [Entamoeba marina]
MVHLENIFVKNVLFYLTTIQDIMNFEMVSKNCQMAIQTVFINPFTLSETVHLTTINKIFPNLQTFFITNTVDSVKKRDGNDLPIIECGSTFSFDRDARLFSTVWFPPKLRKVVINNMNVLRTITDNISRYEQLQEVSIRATATFNYYTKGKRNLYNGGGSGITIDLLKKISKIKYIEEGALLESGIFENKPYISFVIVMWKYDNSNTNISNDGDVTFGRVPTNVKYYFSYTGSSIMGSLTDGSMPVENDFIPDRCIHESLIEDSVSLSTLLLKEYTKNLRIFSIDDGNLDGRNFNYGHYYNAMGNQPVNTEKWVDFVDFSTTDCLESLVISSNIKKLTIPTSLKRLRLEEYIEVSSQGQKLERLSFTKISKNTQELTNTKELIITPVMYNIDIIIRFIKSYPSYSGNLANMNMGFGFGFGYQQQQQQLNNVPVKKTLNNITIKTNYEHVLVYNNELNYNFSYCDEKGTEMFKFSCPIFEHIPHKFFIASELEMKDQEVFDLSEIKEKIVMFIRSKFNKVVFKGKQCAQVLVFCDCEIEELDITGTNTEVLELYGNTIKNMNIKDISTSKQIQISE